MNGIHDMGGMDGFGPVRREANEPVFHADWERRAFAIVNLAMAAAGINIDEFRHAIERIPAGQYLGSSYYERWLSAVETLIVEHGLATREELIAKLDGSAENLRGQIASGVRTVGPDLVKEKAGAKSPQARFAKGDVARARNLNPSGHTRLPRYVRGKRGVIARDWGVFVFPDTNAHHAGTKPQHCYSVAFEARELWGKSASQREKVLVDLWEDYLEPIEADAKPRRRKLASSKRESRASKRAARIKRKK
jgi:nitrile hydratase subunit beta